MQETIQNYIQIGHTATGSYLNYECSDLQDFATPSGMQYGLHDVDKDPFTDLTGFTHRNRVRSDVYTLDLTYNYLAPELISYLLKRIKPEWFYVNFINPNEDGNYIVHKMYASDKTFSVLKSIQLNGKWSNDYVDLTVTFVEE